MKTLIYLEDAIDAIKDADVNMERKRILQFCRKDDR